MSSFSKADDPALSGWKLGSVVLHYEPTRDGPATVSTGSGDKGGISYGSYQLSTKTGTVQEYLKQSSYISKFKDLEPGTESFGKQWKLIASSDPGFDEDQRKFIEETHYQSQLNRLKADGVDMTHRGIAVQEALWSTAVQYRNNTKSVSEGAFQEIFGKDYKEHLNKHSDKELVSAIQDYKFEHVDRNFRSSEDDVREGIRNRISNEKHDLIELAEGRNPYRHKAHEVHKEYSWQPQIEEGRKLRQQEEQSIGQTVTARPSVRFGY